MRITKLRYECEERAGGSCNSEAEKKKKLSEL